MRPLVLVLVTLGFLIGGAVVGYRAWSDLGAVEMSRHGYIALIGGSILTFALAVGLMALVFHSNRHGYDDIDVRDE